MIDLLLYVFLTWMVFPILALVAESASVGGVEGTARLRPWPAEDNDVYGGTYSWDRCVLDSCVAIALT